MAQGPKWTEAERVARLAKLVERNRSIRSGDFLYEDPTWMRDAYVTRRLSLRKMAAEASCGLRTIARWMAIHGIETDKDRKPQWATGADSHAWRGGPPTCEECGVAVKNRGSRRCLAHRENSGEKSGTWRGEHVGYTGLHYRLVASRGKAKEHPCAHCGGQAEEWAYDHNDPDEKRNLDKRDSQAYSLDPDHYDPLCKRCHRRFDFGRLRRG